MAQWRRRGVVSQHWGGFTLATSTILTKISYLFYFVDVTYSVADLDPRAFTSDSSLRGCAVASN